MDLGFLLGTPEAGASVALIDDVNLLEGFLKKATMMLGFKAPYSMVNEESRVLRDVFSHGVRRTYPSLTTDQAMEIVMDMATSGEPFAWRDKFTRTFFMILRNKFGKETGVASIGAQKPEPGTSNDCDLCIGGNGIVLLPKGYGNGSAACLCTKGRYLLSCWVKNTPKALDIQHHPHIVERIRAERNSDTIPFAGSVRELAELFKERSERTSGKRVAFQAAHGAAG